MNHYLNTETYFIKNQKQPLTEDQVKNSAGGYVYKKTIWQKLDEMLILGSEGGSYYASEKELTRLNITNIRKCIDKDGTRVVIRIKQFAQEGRVPKRDVLFYTLALCFTYGDQKTKEIVKLYFTDIINTGSDLFTFVSFIDNMRGWGRALRNLIASWYRYKNSKGQLDYQLLKYQRRNGWSHKDLLKKCHLGTTNLSLNTASIRWATNNTLANRKLSTASGEGTRDYTSVGELPALLQGYEEIKRASKLKDVLSLIEKHRMTHEMVPNQWKNEASVWGTLLPYMPVMATIRNLNKLTQVGLLKPFTEELKLVKAKLSKEAIRKAKIHPLQVLIAQNTYSKGHSIKGSLTWDPISIIVSSLERAFYHAFKNVKPTGKNILLSLDISGSMHGSYISDQVYLTPAMASSALALVTARTEENYHISAFDTNMYQLPITAESTLKEAMDTARYWGWGGTDCAQPLLYAMKNELDVDAFVMYTDSETWAGEIHVKDAFDQYRNRFNKPDAKVIVVGMVSNGFTIADPKDPNMLDIVGFDSASPSLISSFITDNLFSDTD